MSLKPGSLFAFQFVTQDSTGAAVNADTLPTGRVVRNGNDDTTPTVTITNIEVGIYKASCTIPSGYALGDTVQVRIAATVNSVAAKGVTDVEVLSDPVTEILAGIVEAGFTVQDVLKIIGSFSAGKASGAGTATVVFRNLGDTLNRVTMSVDASGNRGTVTLNLT